MNEKGIHKQVRNEGLGIPGMVPDESLEQELRNYTVKYYKGNIDEPSDLMMLQSLETKGLLGDEIVLMDRQTNFFEGTFFVVLRYMEKRP